MKKNLRFVAALLCFVLLLCSCTPAEPDTPDEPDPVLTTEPDAADPRQTPEALAFYNAEKEPWGVHDFSIYNYDGVVLSTPQPTQNDFTLDNVVFLSDNNICYRGIALGDNVYYALKHMQLPNQAIFASVEEDPLGPYPIAMPFSIEKIVEDLDGDYLICIYFNKDFEVLSVNEVYPFTEKVDAQWQIQIQVGEGVIKNYSAASILYTEDGER